VSACDYNHVNLLFKELIVNILKNKVSLLALFVPGRTIKGLVYPKMKILSVFTHPHVVPTP